MQDIVVGNKNFTDVTKPSEIVQLLLNEDQLANLETTAASSAKKNGKKTPGQADTDAAVRDLWNDEGDEFFGQPTQPQGGATMMFWQPTYSPGSDTSSSSESIDSRTAPLSPVLGRRLKGRQWEITVVVVKLFDDWWVAVWHFSGYMRCK